jgi:hypothetical protein
MEKVDNMEEMTDCDSREVGILRNNQKEMSEIENIETQIKNTLNGLRVE